MFKNKVVWITGASSGIGKELAVQFNEKGAIVVLSARNKEKLESVQASLTNEENSFVLPLDLEKSENFKELATSIFEKYGRIDYLVNNGGLSQRGEVSETSLEIDRKIMEVNYFGNVALQKLFCHICKVKNRVIS